MNKILSVIAILAVLFFSLGFTEIRAEEAVRSSNLSDLIVINGLFGDLNTNDLAGLIAVDNIFRDGGSLGGSDLVDLIILDELFSDGGFGGFGGSNDLADLIILDELFR